MNLYLEHKHLQIVDKILAKYDYSFFAFGSRVNGKNKKFSDLDIFFFEEIPSTDLSKLEEEFEESDLPFKVDIVNFKECEQSFQAIMMQNYVCLHSSSKLKQIEQNYLGHFAHLPKNLGFDVHQAAGVTVINSKLKTSMFNIAYGALNDYTTDIDQIKQTYKGQQFLLWIPPSEHNPNTTKALIANGFVIETIERAMICDLTHFVSLEHKTDLMIRFVTNTSLLQDFISVLEPYDHHASTVYGRMSNELLQANEKLVVGYSDGKPISVGILFIATNSAGIFNLVTNDDSENSRYCTDMMLLLMKFAKDHGCKSITLSASSDSDYTIYERLGFVQVGEFECFRYNGD